MADTPQEHQGNISDELNRKDERQTTDAQRPHPSEEEARQEIEDEDRFEATDN